MAKTSKQDATGTAVGYYYQGLFALLVLLDSNDGEIVSIETGDDIQHDADTTRLMQLKHAQDEPPPLTEKNDGLWKTLAIWIPKLTQGDTVFAFVTCAALAPDSALAALAATPRGESLEATVLALDAEAQRVRDAVASATAAGKKGSKLPFRQRSPGATAYLQLEPSQRAELVRRITILAHAPRAVAIEAEVEKRLGLYPAGVRPKIARALLEWWDFRVTRSLIGTAPREISKDELLTKAHSIAAAYADENLNDDFGSLKPTSADEGVGTNMMRQIQIVDGGEERVHRASLARWRARAQRARWIADSVGRAEYFREFDEKLAEFWRDRHGPLRDDCSGADDALMRQRGRELLDWSHLEAYLQVPQGSLKWTAPFVVQGSYQELAEQLKVGWHPQFEELMLETTEGEEDGS